MMPDLFWLLGAAGTAAVLTGLVRTHALSRNILDVPNARSSHTQPTPRGGGLAVVVTLLASVLALWGMGLLNDRCTAGLLSGGSAIAIVGYMDDRKGVGASRRFAVHVLATLLSLTLLIGVEGSRQILPVLPGVLAFVLLALGTIWSINLFNFMDGIDGFAGSQAVFVSGATAVLIASGNGPAEWLTLSMLTSGACAGFLTWNWPPARIFMGDVGSGFLGFWLAAVAIALHVADLLSLWTSLILGMLFVADATVTLLRRIVRGEKWYDAHRSHAYQHLARRFRSHGAVTGLAWGVNLLLLFPLALLASKAAAFAPYLATGSFVLVGTLCLTLGAGKSEQVDGAHATLSGAATLTRASRRSS